MRTLFGAVAGALTVGALLVSYNLGERRAFNRDQMAPTTQMVVGPDGIARAYLVTAGQPSGWSSYSGAVAPYGYGAYPQGGYLPAQQQYATERLVSERPVVRRVAAQRVSSEARPQRTWQKSALLIGGSAGAGAGLGAVMGGRKGALAGAALGGGAAAIYDQAKRH